MKSYASAVLGAIVLLALSVPAALASWPEGIHGLSTADAVIEGRVLAIRSFQDADTILSEATLSVLAVLSGDVFSDRVTVRYAGGVVDDLGLMVSGEPEFQVGEEVRVDLLREPDGAYRVDGGNAGKVTLGGIGPLYGYGGYHWADSNLPVRYYITAAGTADCSGEHAAIQAALQTWEDVTSSYMDFTYQGTTSKSGQSQDNQNVISWGHTNGSVATTYYWFNPSTKLVFEFDMVFEDNWLWGVGGETNRYDVQDVTTHESGHIFVLGDLYNVADAQKTMYGYVSYGETKKRTLDVDDINGASAIYPDTCAAPGAPALSTPADNAGTNDITPTLAWSAATGATSYRLQVDDSTGFGSPAIDQTQAGTSFTPGAALARGTYYWRVQASNSCGTGAWSSYRTLRIVTFTQMRFLPYVAHNGTR